jgi:hypothetical protein
MVKYHETTYEDYISEISKCNFHKELQHVIGNETTIEDMTNYIFNGPCGIGKYSQALLLISRFSPSKLKYEKKVHLTINKNEYTFKISDIHYEVDFLTMGCNAKIVWTEIFNTIVNIVLSNGINNGIILCHNFNHISAELLDIFYSYIQQIFYLPINLRFIFLTERISFLPIRIINNAMLINIGRPNKVNINKRFGKHSNIVDNLKELYLPNVEYKQSEQSEQGEQVQSEQVQSEQSEQGEQGQSEQGEQVQSEYKIVDELIMMITDQTTFKISQLREILYDLLTYDIKMYDVLNTIIMRLIENSILDLEKLPELMNDMHICMYQYNNNYRPIYHLENMIVKIVIHANK